MLAELARMRTDRPHLPLERGCDVDDVIGMVAHDEKELADAVRGEAFEAVLRVIERARCAEVRRVHHGPADGAVVGSALVDAIANAEAGHEAQAARGFISGLKGE